MSRLKAWCGAVAMVALIAGCAVSSETKEGRELADTVKVDGYRRLYERHKAETTLLYFVGPAGVDLNQAVTARGWTPEPPPSGLPDVGAYKWVIAGSANTNKHKCRVTVSTLRPGFASTAAELTEQEKRELAEGRLVYVEVACFCAGPP